MTKEELEKKIKENVINNLIDSIAKIESDNVIAKGTIEVLKSVESIMKEETDDEKQNKKQLQNRITETSQLLKDSQIILAMLRQELENRIKE